MLERYRSTGCYKLLGKFSLITIPIVLLMFISTAKASGSTALLALIPFTFPILLAKLYFILGLISFFERNKIKTIKTDIYADSGYILGIIYALIAGSMLLGGYFKLNWT